MNIPHKRSPNSVPLVITWPQIIIAIPILNVPHSLPCFAHAIVGQGSINEYAAFDGDEGLFAHHSVIVDLTAQHFRIVLNKVSLKLIPIIRDPLPPTYERKTRSVQRQQAMNVQDDVWSARGSMQKPKGAVVYSLPYLRDFLLLCGDNKGRSRIVNLIEVEQGILIACRKALRTDHDLIGA